MSKNNLSRVQEEIKKALESQSEKSRFSEAVLAKKIRENTKLEGKKKAGIGLADLEKAVLALEEEGIYFSIIMNSANDLILEKTEKAKALEKDARQRRLKSEKSMSILTDADFKNGSGKSGEGRPKIRTERKKINIYSDFEDEE